MRKFQAQLKPYLRDVLNLTRYEVGITQEEMAHFLFMAPRSYCDLEHGESGFSAVTLMLLLAYLPDDAIVRIVRDFFDILIEQMEKEENG